MSPRPAVAPLRTLAVVLATGATMLGSLLVAAPAASAAPVEAPGGTCRPDGIFTVCTWTREGSFTVPAGVGRILIETLGGEGGDGVGGLPFTGEGGGGTYVTSYEDVRAGESFSVAAGRRGADGTRLRGPGGAGGAGSGRGGNGAGSFPGTEVGTPGGGGGGASAFESRTHLTVAAGGGGGGGADRFAGGDGQPIGGIVGGRDGQDGRRSNGAGCGSGGGGGGVRGGASGAPGTDTFFTKARCDGGFAGLSTTNGEDGRVLTDRDARDGYVRVSFPTPGEAGGGGPRARTDLDVDLTVPRELAVGETGQILVRVTNTSATPAREAALSVRVPRGLEIVSGGSAAPTLGELAPGGSTLRQFTVRKRVDTPADVVIVSARSATPDSAPRDNTEVGTIRLDRAPR